MGHWCLVRHSQDDELEFRPAAMPNVLAEMIRGCAVFSQAFEAYTLEKETHIFRVRGLEGSNPRGCVSSSEQDRFHGDWTHQC